MTNTPSPDEDRELIETMLVDAYKRGWREGCETLVEEYPDERIAVPHLDAMGEGCGTYMNEVEPRLESLLSDRAKLEEALRGIACAIRLGAETDVLAWANLARACQQTATDALNRSTDRAT